MPIDATTFRAVMGCFATGVTVITTAVDGRLHGLTANAVTSVSLDPLLVLVCVDKKANAHAELERASSFGVNILSNGQQDVSKLFATSGPPEPARLRGVAFDFGTTGVPLIRGTIATLECTVESRLPGGDHTIVVGCAVAGRVSDDSDPLLYFRGKYRRIAS
jgi:flavin reductase (DIM6/NTAB) family NADH-FMN oxidoreductase RutF